MLQQRTEVIDSKTIHFIDGRMSAKVYSNINEIASDNMIRLHKLPAGLSPSQKNILRRIFNRGYDPKLQIKMDTLLEKYPDVFKDYRLEGNKLWVKVEDYSKAFIFWDSNFCKHLSE